MARAWLKLALGSILLGCFPLVAMAKPDAPPAAGFVATALRFLPSLPGKPATATVTVERRGIEPAPLKQITARYISRSVLRPVGASTQTLDLPAFYGDGTVACSGPGQACADGKRFEVQVRQMPLCGLEYPHEADWNVPCARRPAPGGLAWVELIWAFDGVPGNRESFVVPVFVAPE